jgi:hypothetical protein
MNANNITAYIRSIKINTARVILYLFYNLFKAKKEYYKERSFTRFK